jgi:hypothetical protein
MEQNSELALSIRTLDQRQMFAASRVQRTPYAPLATWTLISLAQHVPRDGLP